MASVVDELLKADSSYTVFTSVFLGRRKADVLNVVAYHKCLELETLLVHSPI